MIDIKMITSHVSTSISADSASPSGDLGPADSVMLAATCAAAVVSGV